MFSIRSQICACSVCALALLILAFGFRPALSQAASGKADQIRDADQAWMRVFAAKDLEKSLAACAPDAAVLAPNAPIATGREQISHLFQGFFAVPALQISWHPTQVDVARSGEIGYSTGVYEMHFTDAAGKPAADTGKYLTVWKRASDGKWQVVRDIFNSDLPAGH